MTAFGFDFVERPTTDYFVVGRDLMTPENVSLFFCRPDS